MDDKKTHGDNFMEKLLFELHDIALSLRTMSGRSKVVKVTNDKSQTYKEKYFSKSK